LKELFVDSGGLPSLTDAMTTGVDEKDETELIEMEDGKEDTEPQLIVEEGTVGVASDTILDARKRTYDNEDGDGDSDDDKDDLMNHSWEDAYEQEI
jgi:hypothetical protein